MDQSDCTNVIDSDRYSENRRDRWRYWRCRGGRGGGDDWSTVPESTQTATSTTSCDYSTQPTAAAETASPPDSTSYSDQNASFTGYSQTDIGEGKRTSSASLIAGLASGIALIIILGVLWWFLRRRRSRQPPAPNKDDARSMEQQQSTHPEAQQVSHGQRPTQEPTRDASHLVAHPPKTVARHAVEKNMSSLSSASLPTQLPTFPSPTPRDRKISTKVNASSSSVPYGESYSFPLQPYIPDVISGYAADTTEITVSPNDFYIDMLGLGTDKGPSNFNMKAEVPSTSAPPSPLPLPRPTVAAASPPTAAPLPLSPRSRSSSIASLKKYSETARIAGASPKLSRDARQMVQQFPPPPPPPQVPPPAIPDEALIHATYTRTPRSRTPTTSFEGKEPSHQYWVPTSSGSRPSSYVSVSGRKEGSPARGKRSAARSASLTRKATDPAHRPSPEPHLLPGFSSPYHQDGIPKDKKSLRSHRRSQSNIYAGGSTASMDALDRSLNISPVQFRAPSNIPRPILRQNNSYGGQSSDSNPDVEGIISGAIAITAAKKQSDVTAPSVSVFQDKHLYI